MKIANKISISFFAVALLLASIGASAFYFTTEGSLRKAIYNNLTISVISRTNLIELYLRMLKTSTVQLSKSVVLPNLLKTDKKDPGYQEAFETATNLLIKKRGPDTSVYEYMMLDPAGQVVAATNKNDVGQDKSQDASFLAAQKEAFLNDIYYYQSLKEPLMEVSAPFLDTNNDALLGVLVAKIKLNELYSIVSERTGLGKTGEIYIVNKEGLMITPSRFKEDALLKQKVDIENIRHGAFQKDIEQSLSENLTLNVYPDYRGVPVLGTHTHILPMRWGVVAEMDAAEAFEPLAILRFLFIVIIIVTPIVSWLLGMFIAKLITGPLSALHQGVEIIGKGNLDYKVGTNTKDEVGQLARVFDIMTENLRRTTTSVEKLNKEIADRKRAEGALGEIEANQRTLIKNMPQRLFYKDLKSVYVLCNERYAQDLKIKTEEIKGKTDYSFFPKDIAERHQAEDQKIIALGGMLDTEEEYSQNGEKQIVQKIKAPVKDEEGKIIGIFGMFWDITERKNAEAELKKAYEELKFAQAQFLQSEKMAAIGQLSAGVAHEIKNPLAIILLAIETLEERLSNVDENIKKKFQVIKNAAERTNKVVVELLRFSRYSRIEMKPVDLSQVIDSTVDLVKNMASIKSIEIKKEYGVARKVIIWGDQILLGQVLFNLLTNAMDAIEGKGTITIKTFLSAAEDSTSPQEICVEIIDTGCGIPSQIVPRVFEPFFTTKEQGKGTGLGLSTVYMILERHHGKISLESQEGIGTKIKITLPLSA